MTEGERLMAIAQAAHMHPISIALLARWAETGEGAMVAAGKPFGLVPTSHEQSVERLHDHEPAYDRVGRRGRRRRNRGYEYDYDWGLDE